MTAGCAQCGDCCENIQIDDSEINAAIRWMLAETTTVEQIQEWVDTSTSLPFILDHWHRTGRAINGRGIFRCDAFDTVHRRCTAHTNRPRVCSGYPWYNGEPNTYSIWHKHCSYWADVPAADRPAGVRPLIPLTPVSRPDTRPE